MSYNRYLMSDLNYHANLLECRLAAEIEKIAYEGSFIELYQDIFEVILSYVEFYLEGNYYVEPERYVFEDIYLDVLGYLQDDYEYYFSEYDIRAGFLEHQLLPIMLMSMYQLLIDLLIDTSTNDLWSEKLASVHVTPWTSDQTHRIFVFNYFN